MPAMLVAFRSCGLADELPPNGRWGPGRDVIATDPMGQSWCGRGVGQDGIRASIGQGSRSLFPHHCFARLMSYCTVRSSRDNTHGH